MSGEATPAGNPVSPSNPGQPPPPPPPPAVEINGLGAFSFVSNIGAIVSPSVVGLAVDNNQQIHRIVRQPYPAGASQTGLEPWSAPAILPGTYYLPTYPASAASTTSVDGDVISQEIMCATGTDRAIYAIINGLVNLGGDFVFSPVMTAWPNGRVDVFVVDLKSSHVMQRTMLDGNFNWTPAWYDCGATPAITLSSAISCAPNLIDMVGSDRYGDLHLTSWNGSAWSVSALDFSTASDATLASGTPGRLDVLTLDTKGQLNHRWRVGNTWSAWEVVGGDAVLWAKPGVASWGQGRLDVVVVAANGNTPFHTWYNGTSWQGWESLGGAVSNPSTLALAAPVPGWLEVFCKGTDFQWYSNSSYGSGWSGWIGHGVTLR